MERDAINLTLVHEWMTVSDAKLLLFHQFMKVRSQKRYGGWKTVQTLMNISYGIFQRESEKNLRARLDLIKSQMIYDKKRGLS
jgi:hypothetical protein|tara:strand:+ start:336 stop:584 length:249 start_codon:yes stop_codon:yes gene_type:complete